MNLLYLMKLDIVQINQFFENYQQTPMPKMMRELILSGDNFKFGELETEVVEWKSLRDIFSPEIAQKINANCEGYNIPVVRDHKTPEHHVYEPQTGEYLGYFEVQRSSF